MSLSGPTDPTEPPEPRSESDDEVESSEDIAPHGWADATPAPPAAEREPTVVTPPYRPLVPYERPLTSQSRPPSNPTIYTPPKLAPDPETPTYAPPTLEPPTYAPPTLEPPTYAPPTLEPPTYASPTLEPPTEAAPTLEPPTEAAPTLEPPTEAVPTYTPPTTYAPPTERPAYTPPPSYAPLRPPESPSTDAAWGYSPPPPRQPVSPSGLAAAGDPKTAVDVIDEAPPSEPEAPPEAHKRKMRKGLIEWGIILAIAVGAALIIRLFLIEPFFIPSGSMEPTLDVHDRVLVNKLSYHLHAVHRGDVIVFGRPANDAEPGIKDLVKRVIGLPNEQIASGPNGEILINGQPIRQPWLTTQAKANPGPPITPMTVPAGEYFVMGDNRGDSSDSRVFGPIPKHLIVGRAFVIVWPLSRLGGL